VLSGLVSCLSYRQADRRGLCRLSHIGIIQLVIDGATRPTERNSSSPGLLSSGNISAVLMLPHLENILQHAVEDLQRCSTQPSHEVSATCSSRGSADSGDGVLGSCEETIAALRQLLALVRYSRHVRQAITAAHGESDAASKADHVVPLQVDSCCTENGVTWLAVIVMHIL